MCQCYISELVILPQDVQLMCLQKKRRSFGTIFCTCTVVHTKGWTVIADLDIGNAFDWLQTLRIVAPGVLCDCVRGIVRLLLQNQKHLSINPYSKKDCKTCCLDLLSSTKLLVVTFTLGIGASCAPQKGPSTRWPLKISNIALQLCRLLLKIHKQINSR